MNTSFSGFSDYDGFSTRIANRAVAGGENSQPTVLMIVEVEGSLVVTTVDLSKPETKRGHAVFNIGWINSTRSEGDMM